ncbi:MAG: RDD family protein [Armatimonadota bacterium]|nr:RDD family protein [bacterium]
MARETVIMTPEQVEVRFELAGIGSRFIAVMLDTLLQALVMIIIILTLTLGMGGAVWLDALGSASSWIYAVIIILVFVITGGYFLFFEATRNGQTPGKKSVGIRVIRDTGHPIDFRAALLRNIMRIVDSLPGAYGIGIISVFFSPQYRRLGDYVAGTLVVKVGRPEMAAISSETIIKAGMADSRIQTLLPPEAMPYLGTIPKEDYRAIRHYLNRKLELEPAVALDLAKRLSSSIAFKLKLDPAQITDVAAFLEAVSIEWERRIAH